MEAFQEFRKKTEKDEKTSQPRKTTFFVDLKILLILSSYSYITMIHILIMVIINWLEAEKLELSQLDEYKTFIKKRKNLTTLDG